MFILLEHFFTSARPRRVCKKKLLPKSAVNYSRYLRLNNIIAQMKTCTSYKKKNIVADFGCFSQYFLVHS